MSILGVLLSFILAVNCQTYAVNDYTVSYLLTTKDQISPPSNGPAGATCTINMHFDHTAVTVTGTISCQGLSSGTSFAAAHIHDYDGYDVCGNTAPTTILATLSASGGTTFTSVPVTSPDHICLGYTYLTVHTIANPNGEVRVNLNDMYATCRTGLNSTDRGTTTYTIFPLQTGGEIPGFSRVFTCPSTGTPSCTATLANENSGKYFYLGGQCTGLTGNITSITATTSTGSVFDFYSATSNECPAVGTFGGYYSYFSGDLETLCTPTTGAPWVWNIKTDTTPVQTVTCTMPTGWCPGIYTPGTGSPVPGTSGAFTFSVTIFLSLFFSLLSMWLN